MSLSRVQFHSQSRPSLSVKLIGEFATYYKGLNLDISRSKDLPAGGRSAGMCLAHRMIHIAEFEKRLREEEDVQEDLTKTKNVIEGVRGFALKKMLKGFQDEISDKKNEE